MAGYPTCLVAMAPEEDPAEVEACCLPGDITVTEVHRGYLVGRALEQKGPGPWWEYVAVVAHLEDAVKLARIIAAEAGVRAWFQRDIEHYDLL